MYIFLLDTRLSGRKLKMRVEIGQRPLLVALTSYSEAYPPAVGCHGPLTTRDMTVAEHPGPAESAECEGPENSC